VCIYLTHSDALLYLRDIKAIKGKSEMKSSVLPAAMRKLLNSNSSLIPHCCKIYTRIISCSRYTNRLEIWRKMVQSYCYRQSQVKVQDDLVMFPFGRE
jgi:hypothetical protein